MDDAYDCIVIGAGPAGLTAALYLARFRRRLLVAHDGASRVLRIPRTYNVPGFPGGIRGRTLAKRMERQAKSYGAEVRELRVERIEAREAGLFELSTSSGRLRARTVVAATGVLLNQIDLPDELHEAAIRAGVLRYCPICDGYEATGRRVGVVGADRRGAAEVLFLRQYTSSTALMAVNRLELSDRERQRLSDAGVEVIESPVASFAPNRRVMHITFKDGTAREFDVVYPALGCSPRTAPLEGLGLKFDEQGAIVTGKDQGVPPSGLFIAGDVAEALDQISVAIGHGAIAATNAHNHLRQLYGEALDPARPESGS